MAKKADVIKSSRGPGTVGTMTPSAPAPVGDSARLLNREIGILAFNERVFALAEDASVPLLERLRYIAIVSNNIDELFEVRVAELRELAGVGRPDSAQIRESLAGNTCRCGAYPHITAAVQRAGELKRGK